MVGFSGGNPEVQMVLFGGEDAGGKVGESAGRVVGFVEIEEYLAVRLNIGDEVAAGRVCFIFRGRVPEAEEERAVLLFVDVELMGLPVEFKGYVSFHGELGFFACQIGEVRHFGAVVGGKGCGDLKSFVDVIPGTGGEGGAFLAFVIPNADAHAISALNHDHLYFFQFDVTWRFGNVGLKDGKVGLFIIDRHFMPCIGSERDRPAVIFEKTNVSRDTLGELDLVFGI